VNQELRLATLFPICYPCSQTGGKGICLKQQFKDKPVEHKQHIPKHEQDMWEFWF